MNSIVIYSCFAYAWFLNLSISSSFCFFSYFNCSICYWYCSSCSIICYSNASICVRYFCFFLSILILTCSLISCSVCVLIWLHCSLCSFIIYSILIEYVCLMCSISSCFCLISCMCASLICSNSYFILIRSSSLCLYYWVWVSKCCWY